MSSHTLDYLKRGDLFCTVGLAIVLAEFGPDIFDWEPETFEMNLNGLVDGIPPALMDRMHAGITLLKCDGFAQDVAVFSTVCNALHFGTVIPGTFLPADADDCAWGLTEAELLSPGIDKELNHDVKLYLGLVLSEEGVLKAPKSLHMAIYPPNRNEALVNAMTTSSDVLGGVGYDDLAEASPDQIDEGVDMKLELLMKQLADVPFSTDSDFLRKLRAELKARD